MSLRSWRSQCYWRISSGKRVFSELKGRPIARYVAEDAQEAKKAHDGCSRIVRLKSPIELERTLTKVVSTFSGVPMKVRLTLYGSIRVSDEYASMPAARCVSESFESN